MWFDMVKNYNKKSFKVVMTAPLDKEKLIAKTESHGFAIDIARYFDEKYTSRGFKFIIEIR